MMAILFLPNESVNNCSYGPNYSYTKKSQLRISKIFERVLNLDVRYSSPTVVKFSPLYTYFPGYFKMRKLKLERRKILKAPTGITFKMKMLNANLTSHCYQSIMFGRVTQTLDAAVRRVGFLFMSFTFCNITSSCSLIPKENNTSEPRFTKLYYYYLIFCIFSWKCQ